MVSITRILLQPVGGVKDLCNRRWLVTPERQSSGAARYIAILFGPKVVGLAQVEDLADHFGAGRPRTRVGPRRAVAQRGNPASSRSVIGPPHLPRSRCVDDVRQFYSAVRALGRRGIEVITG